MPEGPEIRIAADQIATALVGKKTTGVQFAFDHLRQYEGRLTGRTVTNVETRGKAMLTHFDNGWVIYSHNQLYGKWKICKPGLNSDEPTRQLRLAIHTAQLAAMLYSASDIEVLPSDQLPLHPFLAKLGPDIMSEDPSEDEIVERLRDPQFYRRQLAGLLLDQSFLAGLGNYLRAEILFFARLNPLLKPANCNQAMLKRLAKQIRTITRRSYRTHGITNPPNLVKQLKAEGKEEFEQHRFSVYGREGQPCYHCGTTVSRYDSGGRGIYFCPKCQPAPKL